MSTKHTPGPWFLDSLGYVRAVKGGRTVATAVLGLKRAAQCTADSRLIAAAPELLAALTRFMNCGLIESDGKGGFAVHGELLGALETARAAIAKAVQS